MRVIAILVCCVLTSHSWSQGWKKLLNGKDLSGWDIYIGPSYDTVSGKWGSVPAGLNNDPMKVFSLTETDGGTVLRISGENFGGISTKDEFQNYHLRLEFKWGTAKYHPKKENKRDSGLLYHAVGKHGADFGFWMRSQEFQIQEGDCGDYWGVAGGSFEVKAVQKDSARYVYDAKGTLTLFNEKSPYGRWCIKNPDAEKRSGEWNTLDLYCLGDTAVHVVNGKVVMVLYHSAQLENEKLTPLKKGKIQLQSEGAELFFRNIEIQPIKNIPKQFLKP
jgi:hypothetical protein